MVVQLTCGRDEGKPQSALPGQIVRVVVAATELEIVGERAKELGVLADRDSEPVAFYLLAPAAGDYSVTLDFWVDEEVAASVSHGVKAEGLPTGPSGATLTSGVIARPGLAVSVGPTRVTTADARRQFDPDFAETRFVQIEGARLRTDPETSR